MSKLCEAVRQYGPLFARILLAAIFLVSGYDKIGGFSQVAAFMASKGIPLSEIALALSIVVEIGGGLLLIAGWKSRWAATALFLWLIPVTLIFHNFWAVDAAQVQNQLNHFLKNLCIMGGMLYVMAFGAGPLSMDNRRS
ncbi:MAG TPA: DoxX family protein [Burkholderiales bacterium]|nr:DoxX family protein [Burkholderiales bacterium]